jgi:hypothetical protein
MGWRTIPEGHTVLEGNASLQPVFGRGAFATQGHLTYRWLAKPGILHFSPAQHHSRDQGWYKVDSVSRCRKNMVIPTGGGVPHSRFFDWVARMGLDHCHAAWLAVQADATVTQA